MRSYVVVDSRIPVKGRKLARLDLEEHRLGPAERGVTDPLGGEPNRSASTSRGRCDSPRAPTVGRAPEG